MSVTGSNLLYRRYTRGKRLRTLDEVFAGDVVWLDHVMAEVCIDTTAGELAAQSCSEAVYTVEQDTETTE